MSSDSISDIFPPYFVYHVLSGMRHCRGTGMVHYGVLTDNFTLILLNGLMLILNSYYILTYIILVKDKVGLLQKRSILFNNS